MEDCMCKNRLFYRPLWTNASMRPSMRASAVTLSPKLPATYREWQTHECAARQQALQGHLADHSSGPVDWVDDFSPPHGFRNHGWTHAICVAGYFCTSARTFAWLPTVPVHAYQSGYLRAPLAILIGSSA